MAMDHSWITISQIATRMKCCAIQVGGSQPAEWRLAIGAVPFVGQISVDETAESPRNSQAIHFATSLAPGWPMKNLAVPGLQQ